MVVLGNNPLEERVTPRLLPEGGGGGQRMSVVIGSELRYEHICRGVSEVIHIDVHVVSRR